MINAIASYVYSEYLLRCNINEDKTYSVPCIDSVKKFLKKNGLFMNYLKGSGIIYMQHNSLLINNIKEYSDFNIFKYLDFLELIFVNYVENNAAEFISKIIANKFSLDKKLEHPVAIEDFNKKFNFQTLLPTLADIDYIVDAMFGNMIYYSKQIEKEEVSILTYTIIDLEFFRYSFVVIDHQNAICPVILNSDMIFKWKNDNHILKMTNSKIVEDSIISTSKNNNVKYYRTRLEV
jgi:hypothetical protein